MTTMHVFASFGLTVAVVTVFAVTPAQSALFEEDFEALNNFSGLNGQADWTAGGSTAVVSGPAGSVNTTQVARQLGSDNSFYTPDPTPTVSGSTLVLEFDVFFGGDTNDFAYMGLNSGQSANGPSFGHWTQNEGWSIRADGFGAFKSAVDASGNVITPQTDTWYSVRSVWDLAAANGQGEATLEIKNLTAGETEFTTLYFDEAQTDPTATLEIETDPATFDTVFLRMLGGQRGDTATFVDNLSVVPEPGTLSLFIPGSLLLFARRRRSQ